MARARSWCFTVNNPTDEDRAEVKSWADRAVYLICGNEVGAQGTPHLQGYLYVKDPKTLSQMKKGYHATAHWEISRGSPQDNVKYCSKEGDILVQSGTPPQQGARTDLDKVREDLENGCNMRSIVKTARSTQSIKMAEVYLKYHEEARDWRPEVRWYWGPTGSGKTRTAREWLEDDIYTAMDTAKWFEGYDAHESLLIDDMRKDWTKYHLLLKLLDRYEYRVETKGGSRQLRAHKIAITAPIPPDEMYENREDKGQLLRRLAQIVYVGYDLTQVRVPDKRTGEYAPFDGI